MLCLAVVFLCLFDSTHTHAHKCPLSQDLVLEPYHRWSSPDGSVPLTKTHITLPNYDWIFLTLWTLAHVPFCPSKCKDMQAKMRHTFSFFFIEPCKWDKLYIDDGNHFNPLGDGYVHPCQCPGLEGSRQKNIVRDTMTAIKNNFGDDIKYVFYKHLPGSVNVKSIEL